jgi:predicted amidohydrolase YtcJ
MPPGRWILGQGWNETNWPEQRFLTAADLDAAAPEHPVMLWRSDLHLATVNSLALRLAGISAETPDPPAGAIDRDAAGQPTGVLRDEAMDLVDAVLPGESAAEVDTAMMEAMHEAHRLGLTGVHDFRSVEAEEGREAWAAWQRLWGADALKLRVWAMISGAALDEAIALGLRTGFGDDRLRMGGIKLYADGSLGARTAWMLEPYRDGGVGLPIATMEEIAVKLARAHAAGIAVGIHAIGDRAIHELLEVFAEVLPRVAQADEGGRMGTTPGRAAAYSVQPSGVPHRIEHVQHGHPEDLRRLGELGLVASVQPMHLVDDMGLVERAIGERAQWTYAFRTLRESGAVLALGSDCPVADPNPFRGIHAAVTRQRPNGTPAGGWFPAERLTVAEAVAGYTLGPAHASGQLHKLGSLSPGKLADLIVLDRDIFAVPPEEIAGTEVVTTVFDGEVVFEGAMRP